MILYINGNPTCYQPMGRDNRRRLFHPVDWHRREIMAKYRKLNKTQKGDGAYHLFIHTHSKMNSKFFTGDETELKNDYENRK